MRSLGYAALGASAVALLLSSPAPARATAGARIPVTMWFWGAPPAYRAALAKALVEPFNASQERYSLDIEYRASVDSDVRVSVLGGGGPDLVYTSGPPDASPLAAAGALAPLDAYDRRYGWSHRLLAPVLDTCRQQGGLMCLPLSLNGDGMFYDRATLVRLGKPVPTDRKSLLNVLEAAKRAGLYPSVTGNRMWQPVNGDYSTIFLNQIAGPACVEAILQGREKWNNPAVIRALDTLDAWFHDGYLGGPDYFSLDFDLSLMLMSEGRSPLMFAPSLLFQWAPIYFQGKAADDLQFAPFPRMDPANPYPIYDIGVSFTYSINARSKVKDAAAAVLDRMLAPDFVLAMARVWPGYWTPPLREVPSDPKATGLTATFLKAFTTISDAVKTGHYGYSVGTYLPTATRDVFVRDLEAMWVDEETPAELARKADRVSRDRQVRHDPVSAPAGFSDHVCGGS